MQTLDQYYCFLQSSCLDQVRNMHRSTIVYKQKQSKRCLKKCAGGCWCKRTTGHGLFVLVKYWWASDVMLNFSKSVHTKKQTHLHLGLPEGEYIKLIFNFEWTMSLGAAGLPSSPTQFYCPIRNIVKNSFQLYRSICKAATLVAWNKIFLSFTFWKLS